MAAGLRLDVDLKTVHVLFIQCIFVHVLLCYQHLIFSPFVPLSLTECLDFSYYSTPFETHTLYIKYTNSFKL